MKLPISTFAFNALKCALLGFCFFLIPLSGFSQNMSQTIRGKIIDEDIKAPLIGVNIILLDTEPKVGTVTDYDGNFRLDNIPIGRVSLKISYIGYEDRFINNILLTSAKELVLSIELREALNALDEVVVTDKQNKAESQNEMAVVSAKTFSVEETQRYAGAIDDPARMVASFAGVNGDAQGDNDIVVRGNSPRGILWRLEDIEIPNPNHFASEGGTGGPINALNSHMLANSDFYSGAFAPEYGNALSGVFDIKLRNGNNEKREYSASASILGLDATIEGPFSKNYRGSYIANYRYSSLSLLDDAGVVDFGGVPKYQDASFKVILPAGRNHSFTLFGLGGKSSISQSETDENNEDIVLFQGEFTSSLGVIALSHNYAINEKTFLKSTISASGSTSGSIVDIANDQDELYKVYDEDFTKSDIKFSSTLSYKQNARNKYKAGLIYTRLGYQMLAHDWDFDTEELIPSLDVNGSSDMIQGFINWKYRIKDDLDLVSGLHYMHFTLNNNYSIEPRVALQWKYNPKQTFSIGAGLHSKIESISTYMAEYRFDDNTFGNPNKDLDFTKAAHFVLGYDYTFNSYTHLKFEAYYQSLYDVPVEDKSQSTFSLINSGGGYINTPLVNNGLGTNYGIEATMEQYLHNGLYYLSTISLYKSLYTANDGIQKNSTYDGNYVVNLLAGKEIPMGKPEKNRTFFGDIKVAVIGGQRYTPIDFEASLAKGEQVRDTDNPFSTKGDNIFKLDISLGIRRNRKKTSTEFKIAIQNVTNNAAVVTEYYQNTTESIVQGKQLPFLPVISYKINF